MVNESERGKINFGECFFVYSIFYYNFVFIFSKNEKKKFFEFVMINFGFKG